MIFARLEVESVVQKFDMTRINGSKTYVAKGGAGIKAIAIQPYAGAAWHDVNSAVRDDWFLDYEYSTDGEKIVTIKVTDDDDLEYTRSATIAVVTEDSDNLFSSDDMLTAIEPDVLRWVRQGRATFIDVHREAQTQIIAWFDRKGFVDSSGNKFTKASVVDISEVSEWSKFLTLKLIFQGISNAIDDVFSKKAEKYNLLEQAAIKRVQVRFDTNNDGVADENDAKFSIAVGEVYRR